MKPASLSRTVLLGFPSLFLCAGADAAIIASDSALTGGVGNYTAGNINGQTSTGGTTGYFTGAAGGNPAPGWTAGTGIFSATTGGIVHPLTANPPAVDDGRFTSAGNANTRTQYRDFATTTPVASNNYYFSALLRESAVVYTGTSFVGIAASRPTGQFATTPASGFHVGFLNGSLTLFFKALSTDTSLTTRTLVASPTVSANYMATIHLDVVAGTLTAMVYNAAGTLVNNPLTDTVTASVTSTDLGAFYMHLSSDFNGGGPAGIAYDELRFGTALSDVMIPEPSSAMLAAGALALGLTRRKRSRSVV